MATTIPFTLVPIAPMFTNTERLALAGHPARGPRGGHAGVARCSAIELPPSTTRYCPVM
jgi:hypothetical protein